MKIEYLREYIVLAKYLNFSVAAKQLYLTQPALSRHISLIEEEVGVKLFTRDTHTVQLTQSGADFLKEIKNVVDQYDQAIKNIMLSNKGFSGKLRIGFLNYTMGTYISPIIEKFALQYPYIRIEPFPSKSSDIIDNLFCNKIDVGLFMHVNFTNDHLIHMHDIYSEQFIVILNKKDEFAMRSSIQLAELKDKNFIEIQDHYEEGYQESIRKLCLAHGFMPQFTIPVNSLESAILSVQSEGGIYLLPRSARLWNLLNVACVDIEDEDCFLYGCIGYKRSNDNPAIPLFVKQYDKLYK